MQCDHSLNSTLMCYCFPNEILFLFKIELFSLIIVHLNRRGHSEGGTYSLGPS